MRRIGGGAPGRLMGKAQSKTRLCMANNSIRLSFATFLIAAARSVCVCVYDLHPVSERKSKQQRLQAWLHRFVGQLLRSPLVLLLTVEQRACYTSIDCQAFIVDLCDLAHVTYLHVGYWSLQAQLFCRPTSLVLGCVLLHHRTMCL